MSKKKFYSGRGYIHGRYWGPKELYQYIWSLTEGLWEDDEKGLEEPKEYHRFMAHVYLPLPKLDIFFVIRPGGGDGWL